MTEFRNKFFRYLELYYGERESNESARFGGYSGKSISEDLKISQSQYSRMVSSMNHQYKEEAYKKICEKLEYLIEIKNLNKTNENLYSENKELTHRVAKYSKKLNLGYYLLAAIPIIFLMMYMTSKRYFSNDSISEISTQNELNSLSVEDAFLRIFDLNISEIAPYRKDQSPKELPCIKYQGRWSIVDEGKYKFPLTIETIKGFHYGANELIMFSWCEIEDDSGESLVALEILKNEIWFDLKERDFSFFEKQWNQYINTDFENNADFIKVADVYSLFNDNFLLKDSIYRIGRRWTRFKPVIVSNDLLDGYIPPQINANLADITESITQDYIGNLLLTNCQPSFYPKGHPFIAEGTVLNFYCNFDLPLFDSTKTIPYTKSIILSDQFIKQ